MFINAQLYFYGIIKFIDYYYYLKNIFYYYKYTSYKNDI